ncbi:MAG: DEAD/DEAH box helicase [Oscillospiraceae bacterium]|nr:DEAD/DEAH box helicase [Oscillospiraceae bacterium]
MAELRPYQTELVSQVSRSWRTGHKAPCIVLPCGGGKSVIVAEMAKRTAGNGRYVLFVVHRKELCEQITRTFLWWGVDMRFVRVMMVQTACNRLGRIPEPSLIITDENHHSKASSYRKIYDYYKHAYRVGVTATPVRLDGTGLKDVNDDLVIGVSAKWLIENHCLAPYDYYAPAVADLSTVKIHRGEFDARSAEKVMLESKVYGDVIAYYRKFADGMQAVCYCTTVKHSQAMAAQFCAAGIDAAHIDGQMKKAERAEIVERFRRGAIDILCNVDLISEGFDVPDCSCVIMLRPTQSLTLFIQQSMRCMRYRKGKRAVILDHVGNYARHGMPDDDREWTLEGKKKRKGEKPDTVPEERYTTCTSCFAVIAGDVQICPYCGKEIEKKQRKAIEQEQNTELVKITAFTVNTKTPDECRTYAELLEYAKMMGYKPGWAWYQAKQRGLLHHAT